MARQAFSLTGKQFGKPASGETNTTIMGEYKLELNKLQNQYLNVFGDITDTAYFEEWEDLIKRTIDRGVSLNNLNTLQDDARSLTKQQADYEITSKVSQAPEIADDIIQESWDDVWKDENLLRTGDFGLMIDGVIAQLDEVEAEQQNLLNTILSIPGVPPEKFKSVEESIQKIRNERNKYEDAQLNPTAYALEMYPSHRGMDRIVLSEKTTAEKRSDLLDTDLKTNNGMSIYNGSNEFDIREGIGGMADFTKMNVSPSTVFDAGYILKAPNGINYYVNNDKSLTKVSDQLTPGSFVSQGYNNPRIKNISEEDARYLELSENVETFNKEITDKSVARKNSFLNMMNFGGQQSQAKQKYGAEGGYDFRFEATTPEQQVSGQAGETSLLEDKPPVYSPYKSGGSKREPTAQPNEKQGGFFNTVKKIFSGNL